MSRPIVFVDTETTALGHRARPWEIAIIRRDPEVGQQTESVIQVRYPLNGLPAGTTPEALHVGGWLTRGVAGGPETYFDGLPPEVDHRWYYGHAESDAAREVYALLTGEPVLVGVGVHFDAAVLSSMFLRHGRPEQPWHYAIVDLKSATWGHLHGQDAANGIASVQQPDEVTLPMRSEQLAAALGVVPPSDEERHTALGDARWAARWFDALTGGAA